MRKICITGNVGSGKSFISNMFRLEHGIPVFNSDKAAREILNNDDRVALRMKQAFGKDIYKAKIDGFLFAKEIDAKKLADIVLSDPEKNQQLMNILKGPIIHKFFDMCYGYQYITGTTPPFILAESAILIESESHRLYDEVLIIDAPMDIKVQRVMDHRGMTREDFDRRMAMQKRPEAIAVHLDVANIPYEIIFNDCEGDLYEKVEKYYRRKLRNFF